MDFQCLDRFKSFLSDLECCIYPLHGFTKSSFLLFSFIEQINDLIILLIRTSYISFQRSNVRYGLPKYPSIVSLSLLETSLRSSIWISSSSNSLRKGMWKGNGKHWELLADETIIIVGSLLGVGLGWCWASCLPKSHQLGKLSLDTLSSLNIEPSLAWLTNYFPSAKTWTRRHWRIYSTKKLDITKICLQREGLQNQNKGNVDEREYRV